MSRPLRRLALWLLLATPFAPPLAAASDDRSPVEERAVTLEDAVRWRHLRTPALSPDGSWLAYRVGPEHGPGEVVVRSTRDDTERRFAGGEPPRASRGAARPPEHGPAFSFSDDSRHLAYVVHPDPASGRSDRNATPTPDAAGEGPRAGEPKLGLVELESGESILFDAVASHAFSGERADWIAIHKAAHRDRGGRPGGSERRRGRAERRERERPGPGADLLLRHLGSGRTLTVGHVTEYAFDDSGRFLAWAVHPEDETGTGVHLRDLETGVVRILASGGDHYASLRWLEEGDGLAFLEGREEESWEEDRYLLWGFSGLAAGDPVEVRWDPAEDPAAPAGMSLHPKQRPYWLEDRSAIVLGLRRLHPARGAAADAGAGAAVAAPTAAEESLTASDDTVSDDTMSDAGDREKKERAPVDEPETAGLVIWHWRDERLASQQKVEEQRDRDRSLLALLRVSDRSLVRLADDEVREVTLEEDDRFALGVDRRRYELDGSLDGQRYEDLWAIDPRTGERWLAAERVRWQYGLDPTGRRLLVYRDGAFWSYELERRTWRDLTGELPTRFVDRENDRNVADPPVPPLDWSEDGRWVLLADNWDVWKVPVERGNRAGIRITPDGEQRGIRYRRAFRLDPDDEGLDLGERLYLSAYGERTKQAGFARLEPGAERAELVVWEDAAFVTLIAAEDAPVYAYSRETAADYPDLWIAGPELQPGRRVTDVGAQRAGLAWSGERLLLEYESERGDPLQATLHLPAGHQPGRRYPTIVYIYERMTPFHHRFYPPDPYGFSASAYTSGGYAVLMPDIRYHINDPGMSALWSVLPALDAAVASGVVDPERVGLHGHSWGGYQTAFLVTQTSRFRAAVAGAPLTNMISMYSSIYWNTGSTNQPIFESSQGRFAGDYLTHLDAYLRNSPVFHAHRVETPLLLLHNDQDGAVDWNQGIELFNTLRRLRKPVVMLQYEGENHGLVMPENRRDYSVRMREFFDHHLRDEPAPDWLRDGVRRLDLERHLEERARTVGVPTSSDS